jgi:hypothetical protein
MTEKPAGQRKAIFGNSAECCGRRWGPSHLLERVWDGWNASLPIGRERREDFGARSRASACSTRYFRFLILRLGQPLPTAQQSLPKRPPADGRFNDSFAQTQQPAHLELKPFRVEGPN